MLPDFRDQLAHLLETARDALGIEPRGRHHEPRYAEIAKLLDAVDRGHRTPRGDLDRRWVATDALTLLAHDPEQPFELGVVRDTREEAVAVARCPARRKLRVAADDDRHPRL